MSEPATTHHESGTDPGHDHDPTPTHSTDREVIVERQVVPTAAQPTTSPAERRSSVVPFVAGFITAVVAGAIAIAVFLAVSDSDDDGQIELDVPAVDVDVDDG
jgi:hypothetical protein